MSPHHLIDAARAALSANDQVDLGTHQTVLNGLSTAALHIARGEPAKAIARLLRVQSHIKHSMDITKAETENIAQLFGLRLLNWRRFTDQQASDWFVQILNHYGANHFFAALARVRRLAGRDKGFWLVSMSVVDTKLAPLLKQHAPLDALHPQTRCSRFQWQTPNPIRHHFRPGKVATPPAGLLAPRQGAFSGR